MKKNPYHCMMTLKAQIASLKAENETQREEIQALKDKVVLLLKVIEQQKVKKDSHNSHNPPSQDKYKSRRNSKSLRPKSTRKTGGQPGHVGFTHLQTDEPDEIHLLKSNYCTVCGEDLQSLSHHLVSKRQVVDIPPIKPIYIEYQLHECYCPCGHTQRAEYPRNVTAPIQFGSQIVALVTYFNIYQYVPYARLKQLLKDVFQLSMSEGSIENLLKKAAAKANPVYQTIFECIKKATYLGADETGAKVNGKKWWIWVWQNIKNTFLSASDNRGFATIEALFPEGLPDATIGSDRWAAQLKVKSKAKQLCFPHLQRDLIFLEEKEKSDWATQFKQLLKKALTLRLQALERDYPFQQDEEEIINLEHRLNQLLAIPILKKDFPLTLTFQKAMIKNRNHLFTCLFDLEVPPDNNASERAVRNVKVKQKISGQFKSGQETFCTLRSIIDTLRKRELDVLFFLKRIMAI